MTMASISGGGGSVDVVARLAVITNTYEDLIDGAKTVLALPNGFVDEFEDALGIDAVLSQNENYDATNDYYHNVVAVFGSDLLTGEATTSTSFTAQNHGTQWDAAIDDSIATSYASEGYVADGNLRLIADFGLGNEKNIRQFTLTNLTSATIRGHTGSLQYSDDGITWTTASAMSAFLNNTTKQTRAIPDSGGHRYWCYYLTSNVTEGAQYGILISEIEMMEAATPLEMTLVSNAFTVPAGGVSAWLQSFYETVDAITLNTDLEFFASLDNGVTWTKIVVDDYGDAGSGVSVFAAQGVPGGVGTNLRLKAVLAAGFEGRLRGWAGMVG